MVTLKNPDDAARKVESAQIIKLSEAIRLGSKLRPQCFGVFISDVGSCALAAAYEAVFGERINDVRFAVRSLSERFNIHDDQLFEIIISHNDHSKWTGERIAEWVEYQNL